MKSGCYVTTYPMCHEKDKVKKAAGDKKKNSRGVKSGKKKFQAKWFDYIEAKFLEKFLKSI